MRPGCSSRTAPESAFGQGAADLAGTWVVAVTFGLNCDFANEKTRRRTDIGPNDVLASYLVTVVGS